MKPVECAFEEEVLTAALQSRWPERASAELREHAATCLICSDIAAIAPALDESAAELRALAVVPDSGRVWWLAQLRARREAAATASRPITAIQVAACACAAGVLGACFGATSSWFQAALREFVQAKALLSAHGWVAAGVAAVVLLAPVAVYLAEEKD